MRSVFDFIVEPVEGRYDNEIKIGEKKLMLNSSIEDFKFISRTAKVVSVPIAFKSSINVGDVIIIHHNVFRRYYNQKGEAVDSSKLFKENLYFCQPDQVYLYKKNNEWMPIGERCFIMPIKEKNPFSLDKERKHIGIVKIGNKSLEALGITEGDLVGFKANREFEFIVDDQRLYCMESNDILLKYEYKGDEEEYNPSWAKSS
jgi:co-chaperonin GroES (HSP10)